MARFNWLWLIFLRYYRNLGLRVSVFALLSLAMTLLTPLAEFYVPDGTGAAMDFDAVMPVLTILASSMLAVSTFSLSVMVSAHRAAAGTTTPRVHRLLLEDTTTQSVLATFIGAFVYALTTIVLHQSGFYPASAAVIVMGVTIGVVLLVVLAMLRWIQHLSGLGSVDDSLHMVTTRTKDALRALAKAPAIGASPLTADTVLPVQTTPIRAPRAGYVQLIDLRGLERCLPNGASAYILSAPGAHVLRQEVIAHVTGSVSDKMLDKIKAAIVIGDLRTFEQDATFGLLILSETASKALSPGVNDSGTAIAAVLRLKALLWDYCHKRQDNDAPKVPRVFVPVTSDDALLEAAFAQIARDGAGIIEVALQLRETLAALADTPDRAMQQAACDMAARALAYAEKGGLLEHELDRLRAIDVPSPG